jgi:hypothetical protein
MIAVALGVGVASTIALKQSVVAPPAATSPNGTLYVGYYTPSNQLDAADLDIAGGRFRIRYTVDVRFESKNAQATVRCGLIDPNGTVGYLKTNSFQTVPANGEVSHLSFSRIYFLPALTVGLRCTPSVAGQLTLQLTHVHLSAKPSSSPD